MSHCTALPRILVSSLFLGLSLLQGCAALAPNTRETLPTTSCTQENRAVDEYFNVIDNIKQAQPDLALLLKKFPKGADLHNHLSGTVMPETYLALGSADNDCFGPDPLVPSMYTIASPPASGVCPDQFKPLTQASDSERHQLLRSLSMYRFNDSGPTSIQAGHDQFFATFGRFGAISSAPDNMGPMLAKLLQQANDDNVSYVETMISLQSATIGHLADLLRRKYPDPAAFSQDGNYPAMFDYLLSMGLEDAVLAAQKDVASYVTGVNTILNCGGATQLPACQVSFSFQASVNRNAALKDGSPDLPKIFTQVALSGMLADREPRVVGINLLSGEDASVSMQSFAQQMQFFSYVQKRFPRLNIALHGGELTPCFVGAGNPALLEHLSGPIQAGAKRLGHAVSFSYLNDADKSAVATLMKQNKTLVEVPFTSNAQILGVAGSEHPFEQYFRKYGVAVAFATDDEGVSHADFTDEWLYAVGRYRLTYAEAVKLARASLQFSFLPGASLWQDQDATRVVSDCAGESVGNPKPGKACTNYLAGNLKAGMQWRYEAKLATFDREYGATLRKQLGLSNKPSK